MTATRWPVHPAPTPGQAASSWLSRLAAALHVDVDALFADVGYHLDGPARTPLPDQPALQRIDARTLSLRVRPFQILTVRISRPDE